MLMSIKGCLVLRQYVSPIVQPRKRGGKLEGSARPALTRRSPPQRGRAKSHVTTLLPFWLGSGRPPVTYLQPNRFAPLTTPILMLMPSGLSESALARWVIPWLCSTILPIADTSILGTLGHTTLPVNLHNLTNAPAKLLMYRGFHRAPRCGQAIFAFHGFFSHISWSSACGACLGILCFPIG